MGCCRSCLTSDFKHGILHLKSHPFSRAFLSLARFWVTQERPCMNRVRSLLSTHWKFLRFEPKPNSRVLVMTIGLSINGCWHSEKKKQLDEREQDCLVQKFGLRRPQRFNLIQAEPRRTSFSPPHSRRQKEALLTRWCKNYLLSISLWIHKLPKMNVWPVCNCRQIYF